MSLYVERATDDRLRQGGSAKGKGKGERALPNDIPRDLYCITRPPSKYSIAWSAALQAAVSRSKCRLAKSVGGNKRHYHCSPPADLSDLSAICKIRPLQDEDIEFNPPQRAHSMMAY